MPSLDDFKIARLIIARIDGTMTANDDMCLEAWLESSAENRRFYDGLLSEDNLECRIGEYERLDLGSIKSRMISNLTTMRSRRGLRRLSRIAIAMAVAAAIATGAWHFSGGDDTPETKITPGSKMAILEISDGRTFNLSTVTDTVIMESDGGMVRVGSDELEYITENYAGVALRYDRIIVPRGGEYRVTLPDGSRVWLNSASELRYAALDGLETREVHLKGEAYFEVVHSERPFIVKTTGTSIKVLGTSFNVSAYPDDPFVSTTLAKGAVEVFSCTMGQSVALAPGDQASIAHDGTIEVRQVNPEEYTDWKDHLFVFNKEDLGTIVRKLSRWYDIDIVIEDDVLNSAIFYGIMQKDEDVTTILDMIKKTYPIDYRIAKNQIIIRESK